jgi:hypothetical protein
MFIVVMTLILAVALLTVIVFVAVVVGIRSEPSCQEMTTHAQRPLASMVRRMLGVYVGRPTVADTRDDREECLTGHSTDWWNTGGGV